MFFVLSIPLSVNINGFPAAAFFQGAISTFLQSEHLIIKAT